VNLSFRTDRVERPRLEPVGEKLGPNDLPRIVAGGNAGDDRWMESMRKKMFYRVKGTEMFWIDLPVPSCWLPGARCQLSAFP
jgi:hypothetical protein